MILLTMLLTLSASTWASEPSALNFAENCQIETSLEDPITTSTAFTPISIEKNSFGFSNLPRWFKVRCTGLELNRPWLLEIGYPLLDEIKIFDSLDLQLPRLTVGDHYPFATRPIAHRNFVIPLQTQDLANGIYLRVLSTSAIQVPIKIMSPLGFSQQLTEEYAGLGLYFGIILALLIYNLFLILFVKDRAFAYYVGYILAFGLFQAGLNGLAFEYLWPGQPRFANQILPTLIWLSFGFIFFFTRTYLRTPKYSSRLDPILRWLGTTCFVIAVPCLLFAPYGPAIRTAAAFCLIAVPLVIATGVVVARKGFSPAYYFLTAWLFFLLGIVVLNLKNFGWISSNFYSDYAMQIGSAAEVLLLSLGLGHRFSLLQNEKTLRELESVKLTRILESERLEKDNAMAMSSLSAQVAHDIRSPLSALRIATADLKSVPIERRQLIAKAIDRIVGISNDLLERSRSGHGQSIPMDLNLIIEEILTETRAVLMGQARSCEVRLLSNEKVCARIAPIEFKRAISNLLNNAIESCEPGRGQVHVKLSSQDGLAILEVTDNGCGMSKEVLRRLGQRGFTNGKSGRGTGLGIHHAMKVIDLFDGRIEYTSEVGKGTCLTLTLPRVEDFQVSDFTI